MIETWLMLARSNAPYLAFIAPLIGAALSVAVRQALVAWLIACAATIVAAMIATDMAYRVLVLGQAPVFIDIGHDVRLDGVAAFIAPLLAWVGALCVLAGGGYYVRLLSPRIAPFAIALLLCMVAGWLGALMAGDFVALFVCVQMAWLAGVGLVALSGERERGGFTGAWRMLLAGGVGAALSLFGVALIEGAGVVTLASLANAPLTSPVVCAVGVGLTLAGLAVTAGVAPLHVWTGAAFGRTSGVIAMALGAVSATGALACMVRVAIVASVAPAIGQGISAGLVALGLAGVVIGSVQAIGAVNVRRMAAYANAAQAGCALVSVGLGSPAGFAAALVLIFAQSVAALAVLGGATALGGGGALSTLDGLARRAPLSSLAITAGALSLMGAPLTLGFLGRWRLIEAGVGGGWSWAAGAVIFASLAGFYYGGRLIERLYFRHASAAREGERDPWHWMASPALIAAIAAIAIGLAPAAVLQAADAAARLLTGDLP